MTTVQKGCGAEIPGGHTWPEHSCADCLRLGIFLAAPAVADTTILDEATQITAGDRQQQYGSPLEDARRFAQLVNALTGLPVLPEHFPLIMVAVKLSRLSQAPLNWHRDSWVDVAGYARVAEKLHDEYIAEDDTADARKAIDEALR